MDKKDISEAHSFFIIDEKDKPDAPSYYNPQLFEVTNEKQKFRTFMPTTEEQKKILDNLWFNREYNKKSFIHTLNYLNDYFYKLNKYIKPLEAKVNTLTPEIVNKQLFEENNTIINHFKELNLKKQELEQNLNKVLIYNSTFSPNYKKVLNENIKNLLPPEIGEKIFEFAQEKDLRNWLAIQTYFRFNDPPLGCTYKYERIRISYNSTFETIVRINTDFKEFQNFTISRPNKFFPNNGRVDIEVTLSLLLEYGLLASLTIEQSDAKAYTNNLPKRLIEAIIEVEKCKYQNNLSSQLLLIIDSIPPEWINDGQFLTGHHKILIENRRSNIDWYFSEFSEKEKFKEATVDTLKWFKVFKIVNKGNWLFVQLVRENFNMKIFVPASFARAFNFSKNILSSDEVEEALAQETGALAAFNHYPSGSDSDDSVTRNNIDNMMED